ncbi:MAG: hypothetical protein HYX35_06130 [Proteobacteria bacterium]|nr:hypothetical protein [Pseudomonadota bacterium]
MKPITTKDLRECLTLLIPQRHKDGEGGWQEEWRSGPRVWACLWPLIDKQEKASYRIVIRCGINLPSKMRFLWPLRHSVKRLSVISPPILIQQNQFLCMIAREDINA